MTVILDTELTLTPNNQLARLASVEGLVSGTEYGITAQYLRPDTSFRFTGRSEIALRKRPMGVPRSRAPVPAQVIDLPEPLIEQPSQVYPFQSMDRLDAAGLNISFLPLTGGTLYKPATSNMLVLQVDPGQYNTIEFRNPGGLEWAAGVDTVGDFVIYHWEGGNWFDAMSITPGHTAAFGGPLGVTGVINAGGSITAGGYVQAATTLKALGPNAPRMILSNTTSNTAVGMWLNESNDNLYVSSIDPVSDGSKQIYAYWDAGGAFYNEADIYTPAGLSALAIAAGANGFICEGPIDIYAPTASNSYAVFDSMDLPGQYPGWAGYSLVTSYGIYCNGNLQVLGNTGINGGLGVIGGLTVDGGITSSNSSMHCEGFLTVDGSAAVGGNLTAINFSAQNFVTALNMQVTEYGIEYTGFGATGYIGFAWALDPGRITAFVNGVVAGDLAYVSDISDAILKTDVQAYDRGLDAVLGLRPVSFRYNDKAALLVDDTSLHYGLIGQDVASVIPELVGERELQFVDGSLHNVRTVAPQQLIWVLVNSIKELAGRIAALEAKDDPC